MNYYNEPLPFRVGANQDLSYAVDNASQKRPIRILRPSDNDNAADASVIKATTFRSAR